MPGRTTLILVAMIFGFLTTSGPAFAASKEKVLYSFSLADSDSPTGVISDHAGSLYGTAWGGGKYLWGTVFQLTRCKKGKWTAKVLHNFPDSSTDGIGPEAPPIRDAAGNLYGTTLGGGSGSGYCTSMGCGTVFQLTLGKNGDWTERVLHNFNNDGVDGYWPYDALIFDAKGNLYGTADKGGKYGGGVVFELSPGTNGMWTETLLHSLGGGSDGYGTTTNLVFDKAGNLYGTTLYGGVNGFGIVFQLKPSKKGEWREKVLYSFSEDEGILEDGVVFDTAGNLYGATWHGYGTIYQLRPHKNGEWVATVLHGFGTGKDGYGPWGNLVFDNAGNLYGATLWGGAYGYGTVFQLTPCKRGKWRERVLHSFNQNGRDGSSPDGGLIDASGHLYGATWDGGSGSGCGSGGCGTVFEITP